MFMYDKYTFLKSTIESLWGVEAWYALKETTSVDTWRKYVVKSLRAIQVSIHTNVEICDEEWSSQVDERIEYGIKNARLVKEIDELIAVLCSTFMEISFLQAGAMPQREASRRKITLHTSNWKLDKFRKVVYLQTPTQREELFLRNLNKEVGPEKTHRLLFNYKQSKSNLPFSEWTKELNNT